MREIRTLRAMWRALETGLRQLLNGHEEGNLGYKPRRSLRAAAPVLDPTSAFIHRSPPLLDHSVFRISHSHILVLGRACGQRDTSDAAE